MRANGGLTLEWSFEGFVRRARSCPDAATTPELTGRLPRIARLMALAIKFDGMVRECIVTDYADLARLGLVTRARMTQIMNLLNLAPDIQEAILFLPRNDGGKDPIVERNLRALTAVVSWQRQRRLWSRVATGQ